MRDGVTASAAARKDGSDPLPRRRSESPRGSKRSSETYDTYEEAKRLRRLHLREDMREGHDEARRKARREQAAAELAAGSTDERLSESAGSDGLFLKDAIREYREQRRGLRPSPVEFAEPEEGARPRATTSKIGELSVKAWMKRLYIAEMRKRSTKRSAQYAWATLEVHMGIMRKSVEWLYESRHLTPPRRLPFSNKLFPRNWDVRRNRRLQPGEEAAILAKLRSLRGDAKIFWEALFVLAIETAARLQEMVRAEWSEFDLETRNWLVPAGHTKTLMERPIPLRREALRVLLMLKGVAKEGEPRLFHTFKTPDVASALWRRFISEQAGIKGLRLHDLRHEAATRMVIRPALPGKERPSVVEIMEVTGHSDVKSLRRYTNLRGDEMGRFLD